VKYLLNVASLELDTEKCTGCGMCLEVCPHSVFALRDKKVVVIDRDACMECGACALNCAFDALSVNEGVGCAAAIIKSIITGGEPTCGCDDGSSSGGCC
jgi:NAD-dependent dihydropyrimidine dehydrogenase PreA subunit